MVAGVGLGGGLGVGARAGVVAGVVGGGGGDIGGVGASVAGSGPGASPCIGVDVSVGVGVGADDGAGGDDGVDDGGGVNAGNGALFGARGAEPGPVQVTNLVGLHDRLGPVRPRGPPQVLGDAHARGAVAASLIQQRLPQLQGPRGFSGGLLAIHRRDLPGLGRNRQPVLLGLR